MDTDHPGLAGALGAATVDIERLVAFANTGHGDTDELADPAALVRWWQGRAAARPAALEAGPPRDPGDPGLVSLRELRQVVRGAAALHVGSPGAGATASPVLRVTLPVEVSAPGVLPVLGRDLTSDVESSVVASLLRVSAVPGWRRVKSCPGPGCGWVFVDASRNGSRRWCDMADCGNRAKGAAFRARRRAGAEGS